LTLQKSAERHEKLRNEGVAGEPEGRQRHAADDWPVTQLELTPRRKKEPAKGTKFCRGEGGKKRLQKARVVHNIFGAQDAQGEKRLDN